MGNLIIDIKKEIKKDKIKKDKIKKDKIKKDKIKALLIITNRLIMIKRFF